ncbi:MAG TPA: TAXI family TRAP transporter solute-binding subunit [Geminicoccaceae bacterium]
MTLRTRALVTGGAVAAVVAGGVALAQQPQFFRIASGSAGGTYFPIAGLLANAISHPPGSRPCEEGGSCGVEGLIAVAQASNASVANATAVQSGQVESGLASADIVYQVVNAEGMFEGQEPYDNVCVIANLFPEHMQLVLPEGSDIAAIEDLEGKRVGIAQAGSGTQVVVLDLLEAFGITRDDIEPAELNNQQSAERLADGQLDAYFYVAGIPTAAMVQLASTSGMKLHAFSEEEKETFLEAVPFYYEATIPGGTYEGLDEDIPTVAVGAQWITGCDQPEELIYEITKALWNDNTRNLLDNGHAKGKDIQLESALQAVLTPLHPGAEKFYEEQGMKVEQAEARQ